MHENRSSERRRLTPRLAALLLTLAAVLAALLLGSVGVGQAQTATTLIEVEGGGEQIGFEGERALGFRTGTSAGTGYDGWVVTEVELRIRPDDGTGAIRTATPPGLALCEATSSGDPDPNGTCFHLTAPRRVQIPAGTTTGQEVTYTAPGYGHFLATNTEYTLHFTENGSTRADGVHNLDASGNDGEAAHVAGAFANIMRQLNSDGTWGPSTTNVAWARITGYADATPVESQVNLPTLELVSNLGQNIASQELTLGTTRVVQGFTTGPHLYGYTLADIKVKLKNDSASAVTTPVTMSLLDGSLAGNGGPLTGRVVASLTGPSTIPANSTANYSFTSATTVTLDRKATYDVLLEGGTTDIIVKLTASDDEDAAGQRGWSFGDFAYKMTQGQATIFTEVDDSVLMSVNGAINPTLPRTLASNIGHSATAFLALTTFDLAQPFTVGSHNAGYRLTSIDIRINTGTTGTTTPTLTLHSGSGTGTKVADFTGPSALDAGTGTGTAKNYTFRPTTSVTLATSTEYWLVVQGSGVVRPEVSPSDHEDGTPLDGASIGNAAHSRSASSTGAFAEHDASTPVLKIRVKGVRSNSAATGAPGITAPNVFRVPAVLGVDLSDIADIADSNGITKIADSVTYTWQRFAADGTTLEAANIGTGDTYQLTNADAGKKVKVSVSFQDDDNYGEGPLSSVATAAITAAATCAAPTYVGGATQIGPARKLGVSLFFAGFHSRYGFASASNYGSLDNAEFTTAASNDYEIVGILDSSLGLGILLDTALSAVDQSKLVLHVCDQAYAFGPVSPLTPPEGVQYNLTASTQNWATHAERTIYLSEDIVAPTFVSATVNGTSLVMTFNEELGAAASLANSAFTVKKGSGGTTQTLSSTAPSISGSTVTLTLATAASVTATDEDVKVLYTKPTTGTANKLVDAFGNEAATFTADQPVTNELADQVPPTLSSGQNDHLVDTDGVTLTLTFSEPLKTSSVPASSAFTVKATPAGGSEAEVALASSDGVTVSGSTVALKLAVPIAHNDSLVKVTYEKPGTGAVIEDANGNDAADFTDRAVTNNSVVPRVSIERVYADASSLIANAVFRIRRSNMGSASLNVELTLSQADTYLEIVDVTTVITSSQTEKELTLSLDYAGNTSGDLTVTVAEGAGYAPAIAPNNAATVQVKAPASGLPLSVRFSQASWTVDEGATVDTTLTFTLAPGLAEPRDRFTVSLETTPEVADSGVDFVAYPAPRARAEPGDWQPASGGGKTQTVVITYVTLQDTLVEPNEIFRMRFDRVSDSTASADIPSTLPDERTTISILDDDPLEVTDVEVTSTPTGGYYGVGDKIEFTVTFSGLVEVGGGPQFAFDLGGGTRQAAYASGSDTKDLVFSHTVADTDADDHDGISWGANALSLNGGTIVASPSKDLLVPRNADLDHAAQAALPGHKVEAAKPSLESASAMDTALTLTFSEELNTTAPVNTVFTVKVDGGSGVNPTAVSISGSVVTLTLASAVTAGQTVTVSYTKPSTNPIKDLSGKEADAFTDENAPTAPPVDVTVTFLRQSYTVDEGAMESVTVRLSADPERRVVIPINATGQAGAGNADYTVPSEVIFISGELRKTIDFAATDDTEDDDGESVLVAFGTLPTAVTPGGLTQTTVNITDDDDPEVTVSFAEAAYTVAEGGRVTVTVRLDKDPERTVDIPLTATAQGGATAPGGTDPDYVAPPASVMFTTGQTERTFTFSATQDPDDDDGEKVLLGFGTLLPARVSAGTPSETTVSITDDDGPGVNVTPQMLRVVQGRSATYRVTLNTRPTGDVTVTPASDNPDVTFEPATLTFMPAAWNSAQSVTVSAPAGSAGQSAMISHSATSADAAYEGITIPSVTVTVTVAPPPSSGGGGGGGGGFGPAPTAPSFVDGFRVSRPLAVNARPGDAVGDPVAATHPNDDDVTYSLSGADASLFTVDAETGQIRLGQAVTLELGQTYTVNLTATDSTGTGAIIIVVIEVAEGVGDPYDLNRNGMIEKDEVLAAVSDYFEGVIEKDEVLALVTRYFAV